MLDQEGKKPSNLKKYSTVIGINVQLFVTTAQLLSVFVAKMISFYLVFLLPAHKAEISHSQKYSDPSLSIESRRHFGPRQPPDWLKLIRQV